MTLAFNRTLKMEEGSQGALLLISSLELDIAKLKLVLQILTVSVVLPPSSFLLSHKQLSEIKGR